MSPSEEVLARICGMRGLPGESRRGGGVGNQDDVVRVVAARRLALGRQHARDLESCRRDLDLLAHRVAVRRRCAALPCVRVRPRSDGAHVIRGEEGSRVRLPVADDLVVGVDAVDRGAPVAACGDHLGAARDHGGHRGHDLRFLPDLLRVRDREGGEGLRSLADPARHTRAGRDHDHVGAQPIDLRADARARSVAHRHHHDDRGHADDDAEHGQDGPHLVLEDALEGEPDQDSGAFMPRLALPLERSRAACGGPSPVRRSGSSHRACG